MSLQDYLAISRPSNASLDEMREVWETNVFGVVALTQALLPLLRETQGARIVNVSSGMGSLTMNSDPSFPYRAGFGPVDSASKTALNAITLAFAIELEPEGIKVNAVTPGFTKTKLNNYEGTEAVEEGASEIVRVALLGADAPTGRFTRTRPWEPTPGERLSLSAGSILGPHRQGDSALIAREDGPRSCLFSRA